jgi:Zn-dependent peptidase ImmA (M78 family)/transcriptional regulator with XRE-family HTH domain
MNPQVLAHNVRRLRIGKNLSQRELADSAGLSLLAIKNLESSRGNPRISTLESIARALDTRLQDLFLPVRELKTVRFRSNKKMQNRENILAKVSRWLDDYNYLEHILNECVSSRLEAIRDRCSKVNPISAAGLCRDALELDLYTPIHDICEILDYAGIKLYTMAYASHDFFGLSIAGEDGGPAIVVNTWERISIERRIFSAAHEPGHLMLHQNSYNVNETQENRDEEKEADLFAGHFLMPDKGFRKAWKDASGLDWIDRVFKVKHIFHVSYKAVIFRLIEHNLVDSSIWKDFSLKYQRRFNRKLPFKEEPPESNFAEPEGLPVFGFFEERFSRLVRQAVDQEKISLSRGAEILMISIEEMMDRLKNREAV